MIRSGFISLILLACVALYSAQAQIKVIPREKLEAVANPRLSPDSASLQFDVRKIVAGPMNETDAPKPFRYKMTNVGDAPVSITRINTTCSCANAVCDRKIVRPGESAVITVTYDPKGHPGRFERRIFVYTDEGKSPAAVLSLSVNVGHAEDFSGLYHHQMGPVRLRRTEVTFAPQAKAVEKIPFVNLSGRPLTLGCDEAMLPDCLEFATEPSVVADRQEGEIVITFDPSKGQVRTQMPVILKGLGIPPSKSSITVKIDNNIR